MVGTLRRAKWAWRRSRVIEGTEARLGPPVDPRGRRLRAGPSCPARMCRWLTPSAAHHNPHGLNSTAVKLLSDLVCLFSRPPITEEPAARSPDSGVQAACGHTLGVLATPVRSTWQRAGSNCVRCQAAIWDSWVTSQGEPVRTMAFRIVRSLMLL